MPTPTTVASSLPAHVTHYLNVERALPTTFAERLGLFWDPQRQAIGIPFAGVTKFRTLKGYDPISGTEAPAQNKMHWAPFTPEQQASPKPPYPSWNDLRECDLIVEGEFDAMAAIAHGFLAASGTLGCATFTDDWADACAGQTKTILYDNDDAGRRGALIAAKKLSEYGCKVRIASWPADKAPGFDVTDWFRQGGPPEGLQAIIDAAIPYALEAGTTDRLSMSAREFVARDIPPLRPLVADIWPEQAVGFIAGQPKSYKSFLALEMAFAVAAGKPFLGRFATGEPRTVLVVQMESSASAFKRRLQSIAERFGGIPQGLHIITNKPIVLEEEGWRVKLEAEIDSIRPDLLILDPLASMTTGDENSNQEMGALVRIFRGLRDRYACAIAVVHHANKGSAERGSKRKGQSMRGAGALHAANEAALYVERPDDDTARINVTIETKEDAPPKPFVCEFIPDGSELRIVGELLELNDAEMVAILTATGGASVTEVHRSLGESGIECTVGQVRARLPNVPGVTISQAGKGNKPTIYVYSGRT